MATITYLVRGNKNPSNISVRMSAGRGANFTRKIPLVVNPEYFNNKTGKIRRVSTFKDSHNLQNTLDKLSSVLLDSYNNTLGRKEVIDSAWLKKEVLLFFNISDNKDLMYLENYCQYYTERIKTTPSRRTGKMLEKSTINNYSSLTRKIGEYQKYKGKKFKVSDVNQAFANDFFLNYLINEMGLHKNTVGRFVGVLTAMCNQAKKDGIQTSVDLSDIKGWEVKKEHIIYLDLKELRKIENTTIENKTLNLAKDWLLLGCEIGQRIGDLMSLENDSIGHKIVSGKHYRIISVTQKKGNKGIRVEIPVTPPVAKILHKYNEGFPPKFGKNIESATTLFNRYIKEVCRISGIDEYTEGTLRNPDTKRMENGTYQKYLLVSSHICRRSYASNYFGVISTPFLMSVTGHKRETQFLDYIGKPQGAYMGEVFAYHESKAITTQSTIRVAK